MQFPPVLSKERHAYKFCELFLVNIIISWDFWLQDNTAFVVQ